MNQPQGINFMRCPVPQMDPFMAQYQPQLIFAPQNPDSTDKKPCENIPTQSMYFAPIPIQMGNPHQEQNLLKPHPMMVPMPTICNYPINFSSAAPLPLSIYRPFFPVDVQRPVPRLPIYQPIMYPNQLRIPTNTESLPQAQAKTQAEENIKEEKKLDPTPESQGLQAKPFINLSLSHNTDIKTDIKQENRKSIDTVFNNETLEKNDADPAKPKSGGAYKKRNVYKSIIRHMYSYIRKNREAIIKVLQSVGFTTSQIEHAFFEVSCNNESEMKQSNKKQSQTTIRKLIEEKSIYTYILRETLNSMIKNWDEGKHGKVSSKNLGTYRDVCITYYKESVKALEGLESEKVKPLQPLAPTS